MKVWKKIGVLFLTIVVSGMVGMESDRAATMGAPIADNLASENSLSGFVGESNETLQALSGTIDSLQGEVNEHQNQVHRLEAALASEKSQEAESYADMKMRIRFLYETSRRTSIYDALEEISSLQDMIEKATYLTNISEYDRNMLNEYKTLRKQIAADEASLEEHQQALQQSSVQLADAQEQLSQLLDSMTAMAGTNQEELALSAEEVAAYEEKLEREQQIAQAQAIANASSSILSSTYKAQTIAQSVSGKMQELGIQMAGVNTTVITVTQEQAYAATASDLKLMATIIYCEAGAEPYEGKVAVGACIMNRLRSPEFPNTILGVIYDPGQFTPVRTGKFAQALASGVPDVCYQAAQQALDGYNNIGSYLYFRTPNGRVSGL